MHIRVKKLAAAPSQPRNLHVRFHLQHIRNLQNPARGATEEREEEEEEREAVSGDK